MKSSLYAGHDIRQTVCEFLELPINSPDLRTRKRDIVLSRQLIMYFMDRLTKMTLKEIGNSFGPNGYDHSTVIHAKQSIQDRIDTDLDFANNVLLIEERIVERVRPANKRKRPMSDKLAQEIIANAMKSCLYQTGALDVLPPELNYSLEQLIEAREILERRNAETIEVFGAAGKNLHLNIAPRGLAALYTAASFDGGTPQQPNIVGFANGNYVLVIRANSLNPCPNCN